MYEDLASETTGEDVLVQKAKEGAVEAFGRLYDMHVDRVYRHIYFRVSNVADTEDLTQQVFLKAWQAMPRYRKTASPFLAWLMRISHNLIVDLYRARKNNVQLNDLMIAEDPESSPEMATEAHFREERLKEAISRLPDIQQQAVMLHFIEGFSLSETAASLGKSDGATRVIVHRALRRLRDILEAVKD